MNPLPPRFGAIHIGTSAQAAELIRRAESGNPSNGAVSYLRELTGDTAFNPLLDSLPEDEYERLLDTGEIRETFKLDILGDGRFMVVTDTGTEDLQHHYELEDQLVRQRHDDLCGNSENPGVEMRLSGEDEKSVQLRRELMDEFGMEAKDIIFLDKRSVFETQLLEAEMEGYSINYLA